MDKENLITDPTMTYERAIHRLEEIVTLLERGESSLDDAMALFREGIALSSFCTGKLRDMKEEMVKLVDAEGGIAPISELE
ncbi:MAG TPA: exodeoxyribonuclease VII small subunit [Bacillota bacterium]|jgi:exodeoxyribonuclease VII small subunit|nr:exodeoxyribonuclease VII small subunit [Bacillota bacterium]HQB80764.1 exodeoxyribonuclease VII small subunit [Bacillota bacterium]